MHADSGSKKLWHEAMPAEAHRLAADLIRLLEAKHVKLVVAESCTAGLLAQRLADTPGASACFEGGFVTYTKDQKTRALDVSDALLREKGAVCGEVAGAMAQGALRHSDADLAAAITGVAGPEPDEDGNPVGRMCIAIARRDGPTENIEAHYADVGRDEIRDRAISDLLQALVNAARGAPPRT
jgi:nicotinamide-nucleotide amidase